MTQPQPLSGLGVIAIVYLPLKFINDLQTTALLMNTQQLTCLNLQAKCIQKLSTKQEWW
jgi:hypothetical protein